MQPMCKAPVDIASPVNYLQIIIPRLLFVGYFSYLTLLLLTPNPFRLVGSSTRFLHFLDLLSPLAHCISFTFLAALAMLAFRPLARWVICLSLMGYAAATELLQMLIPQRTAEWGDFFQDIAGIALGLGVAWVLAVGWKAMRKNKEEICPEIIS
jgi:VanZ family protein